MGRGEGGQMKQAKVIKRRAHTPSPDGQTIEFRDEFRVSIRLLTCIRLHTALLPELPAAVSLGCPATLHAHRFHFPPISPPLETGCFMAKHSKTKLTFYNIACVFSDRVLNFGH